VLAGPYQVILGAAALSALAVFVAAFRFALREYGDAGVASAGRDLPRAAIHRRATRWLAGLGRQRAVRGVQIVQAAFIGLGITSVYVMTLCMAGIIGLLILG
jgi:hypothetical protein